MQVDLRNSFEGFAAEYEHINIDAVRISRAYRGQSGFSMVDIDWEEDKKKKHDQFGLKIIGGEWRELSEVITGSKQVQEHDASTGPANFGVSVYPPNTWGIRGDSTIRGVILNGAIGTIESGMLVRFFGTATKPTGNATASD